MEDFKDSKNLDPQFCRAFSCMDKPINNSIYCQKHTDLKIAYNKQNNISTPFSLPQNPNQFPKSKYEIDKNDISFFKYYLRYYDKEYTESNILPNTIIPVINTILENYKNSGMQHYFYFGLEIDSYIFHLNSPNIYIFQYV